MSILAYEPTFFILHNYFYKTLINHWVYISFYLNTHIHFFLILLLSSLFSLSLSLSVSLSHLASAIRDLSSLSFQPSAVFHLSDLSFSPGFVFDFVLSLSLGYGFSVDGLILNLFFCQFWVDQFWFLVDFLLLLWVSMVVVR